MKKLNKGFTLVELIIVIAILAIIMLIAIPNFSGIQQRMQVRADKQTAAQIGKAIRIWYAERVSEGLSVASLPAVKDKVIVKAADDTDGVGTDDTFAPANFATYSYASLTNIDDYISKTNEPKSLCTTTGAKSTKQVFVPVLDGTGRTAKIMVVIQGDGTTAGSAASWTPNYCDKLDTEGKIDTANSTKYADTYNGLEPNIAYIEP